LTTDWIDLTLEMPAMASSIGRVIWVSISAAAVFVLQGDTVNPVGPAPTTVSAGGR
jgi:hypothetical protein